MIASASVRVPRATNSRPFEQICSEKYSLVATVTVWPLALQRAAERNHRMDVAGAADRRQ